MGVGALQSYKLNMNVQFSIISHTLTSVHVFYDSLYIKSMLLRPKNKISYYIDLFKIYIHVHEMKH